MEDNKYKWSLCQYLVHQIVRNDERVGQMDSLHVRHSKKIQNTYLLSPYVKVLQSTSWSGLRVVCRPENPVLAIHELLHFQLVEDLLPTSENVDSILEQCHCML